MIVNIGGFGHSGNTALLDFISDYDNSYPVGGKYTETSLFRSVWSLYGILKAIDSDLDLISPHLVKALLLGDVDFYEAYKKEKPTKHDFVRNRRVVAYLGEKYIAVVDEFIVHYGRLAKKNPNTDLYEEVIRLFNGLMEDVNRLATEKANLPNGVCVFRNDPAASGLQLVSHLKYDYQLVTIRDPLDIIAEWIPFYGHQFDVAGVEKFCKQFCVKADKFLDEISKVKDKVIVVDFNDLVLVDSLRHEIEVKLGLSGMTKSPAFIPDKSLKNIGVSSSLDAEVYSVVNEKCMPRFQKLKEFSL